MSVDGLEITRITAADLEPLARFMREQNKASVDGATLGHWYLENPAGSSTVMIGRIDGRIVGMSTTNDHRFRGPGGEVLVAMPQKVLTDPALRGKGIFQRLYQATETEGRRKGVGFFLTVTNAASTPIFLSRFGYVRLPSPRMLVFPAAIGRGAGAVKDRMDDVAEWPEPPTQAWHMAKDQAHLQWRYALGPGHQHFTFDHGHGKGRLVLKRMVRKGVPVMILLELLATDPAARRKTLLCARRLALQAGSPVLMALRTATVLQAAEGMWHHTMSSGLNLLVKGLDEGHTALLATQPFELAFGDLDFL
jgi:GNAT superfamily N-acetyltransferase